MRVRSAVVDASVLYATVDADDPSHRRCGADLEDGSLRLFVPAMVVAEATSLVATRLGPRGEADFLSGMEEFEVEAPIPEDWARIAD